LNCIFENAPKTFGPLEKIVLRANEALFLEHNLVLTRDYILRFIVFSMLSNYGDHA